MVHERLSTSQEVEAYFSDYDQSLKMNPCEQKKLLSYYASIKLEFSTVLSNVHRETYLDSLMKILYLDAKLQILFFFWLENNLHNCSEDEVIAIVEKDCQTYYLEALNISKNSQIPAPFIINNRCLYKGGQIHER
ncbi:hypothetical protein IGI37_001098 [Enterococcus sp. AZ194]|uniref:DUF7006 family protein n=1 Tax=Enterococcus sp. AZ194 TaxID=2774629 RepID=UPI003F245B3E